MIVARKRIVILGGGTGGTITANRLRRRFDADEAEIHVVDRDDRHVYQPGLLFVPFGLADVDDIVRPRRRQLRDGVVFHESDIDTVALDTDQVMLTDGTVLAEKEVELVTEFNAGEVDGVGGKLTSFDGRGLDFDLLVTIPLHGGQEYVERSPGLGDALG